MSKVVGKQILDYVNKSGNRVQGVSLFLTYPTEKVEGVRTETAYVGIKAEGYETAKNLKLGDEVKLTYNRWQAVDDVIIQNK